MTTHGPSYCATCGEYMYSRGHACDPEWECEADDGEWNKHRGENASDAAEKCAEWYWSAGEPPDQEESVVVRVKDGETVRVFDVVAEWSLDFTAANPRVESEPKASGETAP